MSSMLPAIPHMKSGKLRGLAVTKSETAKWAKVIKAIGLKSE